VIKINISTKEDIPKLLNIFEDAKQFISSYGSPQWQNLAITSQDLTEFIDQKKLYSLYYDNEVTGVFFLDSYEQTYDIIQDGKWLTKNTPYVVIHKFAISSKGRGKSLGKEIINFVEEYCVKNSIKSIRIDTHSLNSPMLGLLKSTGFTYCGNIYIKSDYNVPGEYSSRLAFEKIILGYDLKTNYTPKGDQIQAISTIVENFHKGIDKQILLGATGTGKTFTIANIVAQMGKKVLILEPNKTLAGQVYGEFKSLFPNNKVEFYISYYDYFQPEAYIAARDLHIEKESTINEEIEQMRHSAVNSLITNDFVIVVASISCIYGIGDAADYVDSMLTLREGDNYSRQAIISKLVRMQYTRSALSFDRGIFRVSGDVIDIRPLSYADKGLRLSFFGDTLEYIKEIDPVNLLPLRTIKTVSITPATLYVPNAEKLKEGMRRINNEMVEQAATFREKNQLVESQRIQQITNYDLEMISEIGYCSGIENYSRHLALKEEGETPSTLIDFFNKDYILVIDESHVAIPQAYGMYKGDRSRKESLVEFGWRLPSALDNRPLRFEELEKKFDKVIFMSATPGNYELEKKYPIVEQIIRPTYLIDPEIEVRKEEGQIDDLYYEIKKRIANNQRVLVTTLTKKMAEVLSNYLKKLGVLTTFMTDETKTLERLEILRSLRLGTFQCLVGINLLREGLDLPEVSLIAILDANKQGLMRSERSLIQIIGRAARNLEGKVIMYADTISPAMEKAINETNRRRSIQRKFNEDNNLTPQTIQKNIGEEITNYGSGITIEPGKTKKSSILKQIEQYEKEMNKAAKNYEFEKAAELRDILFELKASLKS
jgi:excinuclease ABC subunit B